MSSHHDFTADDSCGCQEYKELSRREFISRTTATAVALSVPAWLPRVTYAQSASDRDVMISIFLRGGADGLTLVPPFGEPAYYTLRPTIAIPRPDSGSATPALNLDGFFGLPTGDGVAAAGLPVGAAADRPRHRLDRSVALALRRPVLHGDRQAGRQERRRPAGSAGTWRPSRRHAPTRRCAPSASRSGCSRRSPARPTPCRSRTRRTSASPAPRRRGTSGSPGSATPI